MKHLILLNDPPYGTERSFNGLRMAHALAKNDPEAEITVFLMADAVLCAKAGQRTPDGYYKLERMLRRVSPGGMNKPARAGCFTELLAPRNPRPCGASRSLAPRSGFARTTRDYR